MSPDRIEQLIMTLRVRSRLNNRQEKLDDILAAHDERRKSSTSPVRIFPRWATRVAIAASVMIIVTCLAVMHRSPDKVAMTHPKTKVVSSTAEIITAGSLQMAFYRGGLEEVEWQLDRAAELFGPWPMPLPEQGLL